MSERDPFHRDERDEPQHPASYDLESSNGREDAGPEHPDEPQPPPSGEYAFCPHCGAPMPEPTPDTCLRCGFDASDSHHGSASETPATPPPESPDEQHYGGEEEADAELPRGVAPFCRPGLGGWWAACGVAAGAGLIMTIAYLAGAGGLYDADEIGLLMRLGGVVRYLAMVSISAVLGTAALYVVSLIDEARVGDPLVAAARMLAIMAVISVVLLINFEHRGVEQGLTFILLLAGTYGLVFAVFRVTSHQAFLWLAIFAALQAGLALLGPALAWLYGW